MLELLEWRRMWGRTKWHRRLGLEPELPRRRRLSRRRLPPSSPPPMQQKGFSSSLPPFIVYVQREREALLFLLEVSEGSEWEEWQTQWVEDGSEWWGLYTGSNVCVCVSK
ncbi:unnamed protein product [Ilex paraguariensis]|uniref:Uncharacterized protein n=1 Tax=Ilex paraguariensis TaxID=185542 RepID=A0ABC8RDI7_9AQUA